MLSDPPRNEWLPLDVARMWGRHWLKPLLAISTFPSSNYLSLPLMSLLNIAGTTHTKGERNDTETQRHLQAFIGK